MELTDYLRFVAALMFVLALIGGAAFVLRAFGFISLTPRKPGERRLQITESLLVDARRRVLLLRRDDQEYLILLSPNGDVMLDNGIKAKDEPDAAVNGPALPMTKTELAL
jgi:flagellar protein FliO/FliZ